MARAREIVETTDPSDAYNTTLQLGGLADTVLQMWENASTCSQHHQDILAILENAVRQARASDTITPQQLSTLREAIIDLGLPQLVRENVDIIRRRFIREGFGPWSFIDRPAP
jgi:hypothetical protein